MVMNLLTHLSQMEFPLLSIGQVHFRFKGCWVVFFIFIQILKRALCKKTVEALIRRGILWHLIWVCTVCLCPIKRTLGLYGLRAILGKVSLGEGGGHNFFRDST